jgi:hypothetical protein
MSKTGYAGTFAVSETTIAIFNTTIAISETTIAISEMTPRWELRSKRSLLLINCSPCPPILMPSPHPRSPSQAQPYFRQQIALLT